MSAVKKYFKDELQWRKLDVQHSLPSDFYLSVWQTNRSSAPLLVLRTLIFLTSIGVTLTSLVFYIVRGEVGYWFIYLTHWGLTSITLASGFAVVVSARCFFYGPISGEYRLPWYVKTYWVLYNVAVPTAFLITLFYWTVLYEAGVEEEYNHGLDVSVHGVNTLLMLLLLVTAAVPSRLLHVTHSLSFAVTYFMFGVIYYLAGGVNQNGDPWVYSVVNWANPGTTIVIGLITGLLLILLYFLTIGIALTRDSISRKLIKPPNRTPEGVPLRQPTHTIV